MKLQPYKTLIALSKEKLDEALAPIRARQVRLKARAAQADLDAEIVGIETKVQEQLTGKDVNFPCLMDKLDEIALLERRKDQYDEVLAQLFPDETDNKE